MIFKPFKEQRDFLLDRHRVTGAFAGKRGGKSEIGAVRAVLYTEQQRGFQINGVDPYCGAIIAPTFDMLKRLSMAKFLAYSKPFNPQFNITNQTVIWPNGSIVYGLSAEKPERIEGLKLNWVWLDEVWQMSEQLFLECMARTADTKGDIWLTGSLGIQFNNPKAHWAYKRLVEKPLENSKVYIWPTAANPHVPKDELERLKDNLDPKTYRQMFEIDFNVTGNALVYSDFEQSNVIKGYQYDSRLETSVAIDWGWSHPMACLFFQYDPRIDTVYLFDEIVSSRLTLEKLWEQIAAKPYKIQNWFCDIAGTQEREQVGKSNVKWFSESPRSIYFKYRSSAIQYGIPIVRSYIKNGMGQRKFFIDETRCAKTLDGFRTYSYPEKDGTIQNENPVKKDDDTMDALRYYFVNRLDKAKAAPEMQEFNRWGSWQF